MARVQDLARRSALCLIMAAALGGCSRPAPPPTAERPIPVEEIRLRVAARFENLEAPGAVFGVFQGPESTPVLLLTLGHANEQKSRPISRQDHFPIASISKLFVGTVILQMADEDLLRLDDPVAKYVAGVPGGEDITLAMLGYHTSGLPREITNPAFQMAIQSDPRKEWTPEEICAQAWALDRLFPPGQGWMYANINTILLGEVIQSVTGRPWHEEVARRILAPMGLRDTGYPAHNVIPEPRPRGYRFGEPDNLIEYGEYWFDATDWSGSCWGAAGNMYSTVDDLARFVRAAARGELVGDTGRAALFQWIDTGYEGIEYGFHIGRQSGAIGSTGDVPGYSAFAAYLPERDVTVVSLANLTATRTKLTAASELGELACQIMTW